MYENSSRYHLFAIYKYSVRNHCFLSGMSVFLCVCLTICCDCEITICVTEKFRFLLWTT